MPEKSVREMGVVERKHYSLAAQTFHAVIMAAVILGLVAFVIGLWLYTVALSNQYISKAFSLSRSAAAIMEKVVDVEPLADEVMQQYQALSDEERAQTGTESYRSRFSAITEREDYESIRSLLADFGGSSDMEDIYLAMYDQETCAMVYIADPDPEPSTVLMPAEWEGVTQKGLEKFLNWDGTGMLYDIDKTANYGWICTSGVPIRGSDGEIAAFVLTDVSLANIGHGMKNFMIQYTIALSITTVLVGYLLTRRMKKTLVQPINAIAEAAQDYVKDKRNGVSFTDHFAMLNIRTGDEVESLSLVMADMERDLSEYEEKLTKITAEKERINTELSLATQIQESMLPSIYPAFPDRPEFDIYATMDPAREVGGDFYDFFLVDDDHLCMVMADVSGKGVPAALFMMASKIILKNNAMIGKSPAQILNDTNTAICSNNKMEMFVTVWLGILEISTGKLTAANAGHEYPALKRRDGSFELFKDKHGFVIGGMDGVKYKEYELQLEPGAKLFVYTDGVPEATDSENELFGTQRMHDALNAHGDGAPEEILKNVRDAVDGFVKNAEQFDDLTMLCMEYTGNQSI